MTPKGTNENANSAPTSAYERVPVLVTYRDGSSERDTYGGTGEQVVLEAHLLRPSAPSDTVVVMMHPIGGMSYLPLPMALARAVCTCCVATAVIGVSTPR